MQVIFAIFAIFLGIIGLIDLNLEIPKWGVPQAVTLSLFTIMVAMISARYGKLKDSVLVIIGVLCIFSFVAGRVIFDGLPEEQLLRKMVTTGSIFWAGTILIGFCHRGISRIINYFKESINDFRFVLYLLMFTWPLWLFYWGLSVVITMVLVFLTDWNLFLSLGIVSLVELCLVIVLYCFVWRED